MPIHPKFPYPLYLVISEEACTHQPWMEVAEEAILAGVDIIQLREKNLPIPEFLQCAKQLKALCDRHGIPLIINDQLEIALEIEAWGIHVGQQDILPSQIRERAKDKLQIGWSLESLQQLHSKELMHVDHLGISPIFKTATKTDTITEWGISGIQEIASRTELPLIAIGNMNLENAASAFQAGAHSIAVVSAICGSRQVSQVTRQLKAQLS